MKSISLLEHAIKKVLLFTVITTALSISASAQTPVPSLYDKYKDSIQNSHFKNYETKYRKLPTSGSWKQIGWSGDYLPPSSGGLIGDSDVFLQIFESDQIQNNFITQDTAKRAAFELTKTLLINRLAPALSSVEPLVALRKSSLLELPSVKFDLLSNNLGLPLTRVESRRISNQTYHNWSGMCNGWATAVALHPEIQKFKISSQSGELAFSENDITKLLTWYYFNNPPKAQMFDRLCNPTDNKSCIGMNPAVFHVLVTNIIGIHSNVALADIDAGPQVWNHPVIDFQIEDERKLDPKSLDRDVWERQFNFRFDENFTYYFIRMTVTYISETRTYSSQRRLKNISYHYALKINSSGSIVDGHLHRDEQLFDAIYRVFPTEPTAGWKKFFDELKNNGM